MDLGEVRDLAGGADLHDVAQADAQVLPNHFVHSDLAVLQLVIDEGDADGLFALLPLDHDRVALEDFELGHLGLGQLDRRVVVVEGFLSD